MHFPTILPAQFGVVFQCGTGSRGIAEVRRLHPPAETVLGLRSVPFGILLQGNPLEGRPRQRKVAKVVTFPWANGTSAEEMEAYYDGLKPGGYLAITRWLKLPPRDRFFNLGNLRA